MFHMHLIPMLTDKLPSQGPGGILGKYENHTVIGKLSVFVVLQCSKNPAYELYPGGLFIIHSLNCIQVTWL